MRPSKPGPTLRARRQWRRRQGGLDPARLVFLDESAAKINLTRLRGRAPRGERLRHHDDLLGAAGRHHRLHDHRRSDQRRGLSGHVLVSVLRPGDIVVLDSLGVHKNDQTLALIRDAKAEVRFLPAYSPDLNPIEMVWSKVKALLRKAQARNHPDLLFPVRRSLRFDRGRVSRRRNILNRGG